MRMEMSKSRDPYAAFAEAVAVEKARSK